MPHATCHMPEASTRVSGDGPPMGQTEYMGFEVHVVVTLLKAPSEAMMTELDHRFEVASHQHGTKTVSLTEHVAVASESDAVEFVRSLVLDAIPPGAKITAISAASD